MASGLKIVNGDWEIVSKKLTFTTSKEKVIRDINKFLTTDKENINNKTTYARYNPNYGVELNNRDLYINLPLNIIIDNINKSLSNSLKDFIAIQEERDNLSEEEVINDIQFYVSEDPESAQYLKITITLSIQGQNSPIDVGTYTQEVV